MKKLPCLLAALTAPALYGNHATILGASGTVAPFSVSLTLSETAGGYRLTAAKKETESAKGVTYPDFTTFSTTYTPDATVPALVNPFGWDTVVNNNYAEKVTTKDAETDTPVVTAAGLHTIVKSRYTNATLLADLVAAGKIPSATGYRLVLVTFELEHEVHYVNEAEAYTTHVNGRPYFFAEKGADDPDPIYLGAEYDEVYLAEPVIAFDTFTAAKSGKYVETFTGNPVEDRYDYKLLSQAYAGSAFNEFIFYRPAAGEDTYHIQAGGVFRWSERYDARRELFLPGAMAGTSLAGPAQLYYAPAEGTETETDGHAGHAGHIPSGLQQAVVSGSVSVSAATHFADLAKYLNKIPNVMPH